MAVIAGAVMAFMPAGPAAAATSIFYIANSNAGTISMLDTASNSATDAITETVTVTSGGPVNATGVTAAIAFSSTAHRLVSATTTQGSCVIAAPKITSTLGTLASAATAVIIYSQGCDDRSYGQDLIAGVFAWLFDNGNDILDGQAEDNLTNTSGTMKGSAGNDTINVQDGHTDGGAGTDTCTTDTRDTRISC